MSDTPLILAIESSCDDTGAALMEGGKLLSNVVAGQDVHRDYGGVVPELASRAHQQHIVPVVSKALQQAKRSKDQVSAVAFTRGPGLLGPLLVGVCFGKSLAQALDIPIIEVNHMKAHVLAHFIEPPRPSFPFLCLTVSGGHTQLLLVHDSTQMEIIGSTRDDAAGEAFDKAGKILGLPYPAGPHIDRLAQEGKPDAYPFPIANIPKLDFSFSGLKTAVLYFARDKEKEQPGFIKNHLPDICASLQDTIVRTLMKKLRKAAKKHQIKEIAIAGGVAANKGLRRALEEEASQQGWNTYVPAFEYCTDNAGMIAMAAHFAYQAGQFSYDYSLEPAPRLPIRQN